MNKTDLKPEIKKLIKGAFPVDEIFVEEEQGKYEIKVIAEIFYGLTILERQKIVYAPLTSLIAGGIIHAISIHTYTPEEWKDS